MKLTRRTSEELERIAEHWLKRYDPERLIKTKSIEVYNVVESLLGVPYDWKRLSPDGSILGLTTFEDGNIPVWEKRNGVWVQNKLYCECGTIVIEESLTTLPYRGRENFTVIHEVFHQILHKSYFQGKRVKAKLALNRSIGRMSVLKTDDDFCEFQANICAAAFLMPRELVKRTLVKMTGSNRICLANYRNNAIIKGMAEIFSVSKSAMRNRLENLELGFE